MKEEKSVAIDLNAVEYIVASYVVQRSVMASLLTHNRTSHLEFIHFCNAQSTLLNRTLGYLTDVELRVVIAYIDSGEASLPTPELNEAFKELVSCQIALIQANRARIAAMN